MAYKCQRKAMQEVTLTREMEELLQQALQAANRGEVFGAIGHMSGEVIQLVYVEGRPMAIRIGTVTPESQKAFKGTFVVGENTQLLGFPGKLHTIIPLVTC